MTTVLGADGCVESAIIPTTDCCPPPLCGNDLCGTFCAFINILPTGPMWDYWKERATTYFQSDPNDPSKCDPIIDPSCPSLIQHAIYVVLKLRDIVHNALYPALRESDPTTAYTTLDQWLERLQWEDCYNQHCRSVLLGEITPLEIWTSCGPVFCPPGFSDELECALKRGIVLALTRANMGVIKNLCGINWIIEPLGAKVTPKNIQPNPDPAFMGQCDSYCPEGIEFEICKISDTIPGCVDTTVCDTTMPRPDVIAYFDRGCDVPAGLPQVIWPGVLAAECIVRSLMPQTCPNNIHRCC